ncbi:FkbM family methyltransferase [Aurantibacillus circumpalustris]|uniref:FkbM family methyltransferase n=1 Tax=Aurantibacillus circumpalustris TaxID=3036359 RepID=UPI00295C370A|nr:FkbM family methyltransferase [Aurantibacillus circumpalustris]
MSIRSVAKFLKLKQLSSKFNFNASLYLNNKKFKIPIIKNLGLLNLKVKEDWFFNFLKDLKLPSDTSFIDVGVNVGQTLLTFRSLYNNPYYGFEPNPSCVFYLHNLMEVNGMLNTHILPIGLSSENSLGRFYLKNEVDSAGTIVKDLRPDYYETEKISYVPLFTFETVGLNEIKPISLIKIDVEGAELEVITGLINTIKKHQPLIICEVLDCHSESSIQAMQERATKLFALIQTCGYTVYRIIHKTKLELEEVKQIKLKLWEPSSFDLNDYLFVPGNAKKPF